MFDVLKVHEIALREGCDELAVYMDGNKAEYVRFILTGVDY